MLFVVQIAVEQIAILIQISNRIRRLQRIRNVLFISPALRPALEDSVAGGKNAGSCQTDNHSDDQPFDCRLSVFSVFSVFPFSCCLCFHNLCYLFHSYTSPVISLCLPKRFVSHIRIYCLSILYPTPHTTFRYLGFRGSISIFSRIFLTCTIMVSVLTAFSFQIRS